MSALILLVHADDIERRRLERILSNEGYLVTAVASLRAGSKLLKSVIPDLLVIDARFGEFSGVQFAAVIRRNHPQLRVVITHASADAALEADATGRGFAFTGGLDDSHYARAVQETLGEYRTVGETIRKWPRKPLATIELSVARPHARVVDVSYGGCRLLVADSHEAEAPVFEVALHARGITLKAKRVWTGPVPNTDALWLGATFVETSPEQVNRWRDFVDSIG